MDTHRFPRAHRIVLAAAAASLAACSSDSLTALKAATGSLSEALVVEANHPTNVHTPIGLALAVEDGVGVPLKVRAGQTFFINQIDLRAKLPASLDEGVAGLARSGDFATLSWDGVAQVDQDFLGLPNPDGTFTRGRFFRLASWMNGASTFTVTQVDATGTPTAEPLVVGIGEEGAPQRSDDMFVRRLRAIQWTYDCTSKADCSTATHFLEEALVEVLNATHPQNTMQIAPATTALQLQWSLQPHAYVIPLQQVASPAYDYGFRVDLDIDPSTPPRADGTFAPGSPVTVRITQRDGSGNRLHPVGSMPSYADVMWGPNEEGLQYYRGFFDQVLTYYRHKHLEHNAIIEMVGPLQDRRAIRRVAELDQFLADIDMIDFAEPATEGVFAAGNTLPRAFDLFGGAFDPTHAGWYRRVSDTWTFQLPPDAEPGTYLITAKFRRTYLGQDIPRTTTIPVQVGTTEETFATLPTEGCEKCHNGPSDLGVILHANKNRASCDGCHVPLGFELEGPIYVRLHFIHSRSTRFDAELSRCANCHATLAGIQRVSKSACLGCHREYPAWHVARFGKPEGMYIGGGREAFEQCTSQCHRNHVDSGVGEIGTFRTRTRAP